MYLLHYLQTTHHLSRRNIVALIKQGKIFVNQQAIQSFRHELAPGDSIVVPGYGEHLFAGSPDGQWPSHLIVFNKPQGYVVSKSDPHNQTIYALLPVALQSYYYIGRLDKESRGLVLLTDSPALVHQFEHPKFQIEKEYLIQLSVPFSALDQQKAKSWIIDDGDLLKFKAIAPTTLPLQYQITLTEGKKRHIRRVIQALGYELLDLQRVREGEYELGDLKEGEWREGDLCSHLSKKVLKFVW